MLLSIGEHVDVLWIISGSIISIVLGVCGFIFKRILSQIDILQKNMETMQEKSMLYVTKDDISKICTKNQNQCPKVLDLSGIVRNITSSLGRFTEITKDIITDQKILRQDILPIKYVNMDYFKDTIGRIEKNLFETTKEMRETAQRIFDKVDDIKKNGKSRV